MYDFLLKLLIIFVTLIQFQTVKNLATMKNEMICKEMVTQDSVLLGM